VVAMQLEIVHLPTYATPSLTNAIYARRIALTSAEASATAVSATALVLAATAIGAITALALVATTISIAGQTATTALN
jgi:hypothetical protein